MNQTQELNAKEALYCVTATISKTILSQQFACDWLVRVQWKSETTEVSSAHRGFLPRRWMPDTKGFALIRHLSIANNQVGIFSENIFLKFSATLYIFLSISASPLLDRKKCLPLNEMSLEKSFKWWKKENIVISPLIGRGFSMGLPQTFFESFKTGLSTILAYQLFAFLQKNYFSRKMQHRASSADVIGSVTRLGDF